MSDKLPLPEPTLVRTPDAYNYVDERQELFTADQMRGYAAACVAQALEEAVDAVEDDVMPGRSAQYREGWCDAKHTDAAAIRALAKGQA